MWRQFLHVGLAAVHVGTAAAWLGAMLYSLVVVQPRAERFFADALRYEVFAVTLASGARWKVLGMCAALAVSGGGLIAIEATSRPGVPGLWLGVMAVKAALLAAAAGLFVHVSWRLWPARLMAGEAELAVLQRRFRRVALVLVGLVGAALVLGGVADVLL